MLTVDDMIDRILEKEGGFQQWKSDKGNYLNGRLIGTNKGIIPAQLAAHRGVRTVTVDDLRNLTDDEARAIYRARYYDAFKLESLPDVLEPAVFDFVVNSGTWGIKMLQRTLTAFGYPCKEDGVIGMETLRQSYRCLDDVPANVFLKAYLDERRQFFHRIVASNESQRVFLRGWLNRVDNLERELIA